MQVENVGDGRVVGCVVLHFKPGALVWWSAEDSEVSVTQSQKGERTGFQQSQGLVILTNFGQPKLTIGAIVIPEVFDGSLRWIQVNIQVVIESLARVFNIHTQVGGVVRMIIFIDFNYI
jgi:hypothetical protein